jgi:hypothetical protein
VNMATSANPIANAKDGTDTGVAFSWLAQES